MKTGRRILYVTADGILQPLGYSQVARVVEALSRRGFAYDIASLERPKDLARPHARARLESQLAASGVRWFVDPYDVSGGGRAAVTNIARVTRSALLRAASGDYQLTHARSYLGAVPALAAFTAIGLPFLFDVRGYWVDERIEDGRWFTNPAALLLGRSMERQLFRRAAGVVTLTELQAGDVRRGEFGPAGGRPIVAIPTCADFDEFQRKKKPDADPNGVPPELRAKLRGRLVVGFVGSLNRSYLSDESARLARLIMNRRPDAFVVALSGQNAEYSALFARHDIPQEAYLIQAVEHSAMSEWLSLLSWGLLLLNSPFAKRGSMPTKLAEFFAIGVRPVQYGCNSEVSDWVSRAGSGYVLPNVSHRELERAADFVAAAPPDEAALSIARERTQGHFSLASGVARYAELLDLLAPETNS